MLVLFIEIYSLYLLENNIKGAAILYVKAAAFTVASQQNVLASLE